MSSQRRNYATAEIQTFLFVASAFSEDKFCLFVQARQDTYRALFRADILALIAVSNRFYTGELCFARRFWALALKNLKQVLVFRSP